MIEPNPCPRCGQRPTIEFQTQGYAVFHACEETPEAYVELQRHYPSEEKAIEAWNEYVGSHDQH